MYGGSGKPGDDTEPDGITDIGISAKRPGKVEVPDSPDRTLVSRKEDRYRSAGGSFSRSANSRV